MVSANGENLYTIAALKVSIIESFRPRLSLTERTSVSYLRNNQIIMLRRLFHSFFLLIHLSVLAQSTLFVDENSMDNNADGLSWNSAFDNLQDALFEARNNSSVSEIWIAVGSYHPMKGDQYPDRTIDNFWAREISFNLVDGVALFGGFRAGQTSKDERNPEDYDQTILTGYDPDYDDYASFTVVRGDDLNQTVTLDGLCIQRGKSDGYKENTFNNDARNVQVEGAGLCLYQIQADITVKNCAIRNNLTKAPQSYLAGGKGGACLIKFSNDSNLRKIILENCVFTENNASGSGGGLAIFKPQGDLNLLVNSCHFLENYSFEKGGALAIYSEGKTLFEISDSTFSGNYANDSGGSISLGIWKSIKYELIENDSGPSYREEVQNLISSDNKGSFSASSFLDNNSSSQGGAIYTTSERTSDDIINFTDCNLSGNYSSNSGGAILTDSKLNIQNCFFLANESNSSGGGISGSTDISIDTSNFSRNLALGTGGAIEGDRDAVFIISQSIFSANESNGTGGAIGFPEFFPNKIEVYDSNFTYNTAGKENSYGGAFACNDATIFNCRFIENSAHTGGAVSLGAVRVKIEDFKEYERPMRHIVNCVFEGNSAFYEGGGLFLDSGSYYDLTPLATAYPFITSVSNCIFLSNKAQRGGGAAGFLSFINCLFLRNESWVSGAVYCPKPLESSLEYVAITNCISWSNYNGFYKNYGHGFWNDWNLGNRFQSSPALIKLPRAEGDPLAKGFDPAELLSTVNQTPILAQNFDDENLAFSADPLFININDPDGPDNIWFTADDGLRLSSLSPGINAGNSYYLSFDGLDIDGDSNIDEVIPFDALGNPRIAGATVDLGPYELIKLENPGTQVDGSLYFLHWFGYYQGESETGWYYHYPSKQWCYIFNWDTSGMFIYFNNLGWGWTNQSISPYFYLFTSKEWVFFDLESGKGYYDFAKSGWQSF
jgi:predicted outer membrane repeat protein